MAAPNLFDDVRAERAKYPEANLYADQCGAIVNAVAWKHRAAGWGLSGKNSGNHAVRYDGVRIAADILHHKPTNTLFDCLSSAGDQDTPFPSNPTWIDVGPPIGDRPFVDPIPPKGEPWTPGHNCKLGVSWFGALGLRRHDYGKYRETLEFHRDRLKPDYARIFWYLSDPQWGLIGTEFVTDSERRDLLRATVEDLLVVGIKPQVCVFGGWPGATHLERLTHQFVEAFAPFASRSFAIDCVNEPFAINFPEYGYVRTVGRICAGIGVPLLSLASPSTTHMGTNRDFTEEEIREDAQKLYGGMPPEINCVTPHWGRNPWRPHIDLGLPGIAVINDEPRGFKSSIAEIREPMDFANDYANSARAGDVGYTFHGEPGVWDGYCDTRQHPEWKGNNEYRRWHDVPRIDEIIAVLHQVRAGQSPNPGPGPGPGPGPRPPGADDTLNAGERLGPGERLIDVSGRFYMEYQTDGNLVIYDGGPPNWIWQSRSSHEQDYPGRNYRPGYVEMQVDGNFVIYAYLDDVLQPIRASRTDGPHPGNGGFIQPDGNFVMYDNAQPYWASFSSDLYNEFGDVVNTRGIP